MNADVVVMLEQSVAQRLLHVSGAVAQLGQEIDDGADDVEAIDLVQHAHVERRRGRAFFLVAAHVEVVVTVALVR